MPCVRDGGLCLVGEQAMVWCVDCCLAGDLPAEGCDMFHDNDDNNDPQSSPLSPQTQVERKLVWTINKGNPIFIRTDLMVFII